MQAKDKELSGKSEIKRLKGKVYFIRVDADSYEKITKLSKIEDRSINNTGNLVIRKGLEAFKVK